MDIQQSLESSSTWVLEFRDEEEKDTWLRGLIQATYQASVPPSIDVFGESMTAVGEFSEAQCVALRKADLIVNGTLVETKLFIYGKSGDEDGKPEERLIIEVLAGGGKVHMMRSDGDLTVKMKLHSFKVKDELQAFQSTVPSYLACSVLRDNKALSSSGTFDLQGKEIYPVTQDNDDNFKDALSDFQSVLDSGFFSPRSDMPCPGTMVDVSDPFVFESAEAFTDGQDVLQRKSNCEEIFYEAHGGETLDFVSVNFSTRSSSSPDYDGIDTQMSVRMSKLEFFCNRPTLVALIGFGFDLSHMNFAKCTDEISDDKPLINKERTEASGRVKGLLGFGKSRVIFYLNMKVDSVTMFLNKENGSQLAMLVQENFLLDLKVHPSSLSIEGTLGNFKLCDMSLGVDHCWSWLCDIRNPGVESLIKFKFSSYSVEDDDYEGYDYCLSGRLSAVRIVFLYRFVQEITVYFMGLATPNTEEAIKLVDKVGGFEWLIQKYEIDGATALKLDLALDTPIIVVPKNSMSKDFIQLDLGQLHVTNELSWYGHPETDPSAVHMDILHAEILGINMSVGVDGCLGKPMIREGRGLDVYVRRSLRDVFRKVPTFSLEIKIGLLCGVMSDREYGVILDCTYMNLHEEPSLPPSFRCSKSGSSNTMWLLVDKINTTSQILLSQTVTVVEVEVNNALLELCNGVHESPLAHLALEGLWVSYRMTSLSETDLYVTIPKFSILDIRPDTRSEMRLMLGSSADASKHASSGNYPYFLNRGSLRMGSESGPYVDVPNPTMFLMDYRWRMSSQSYVVRIQQPRVLVVPDFLLAVGEFFVPAIGTITGREESMDPKKDPINRSNSIVLSGPIYKQAEDIVCFSPSRQLVVDANGVDEYIYDGCGKTISLIEETSMKEQHLIQSPPIIFIGCGKRLRFVNVKIENGSLLRKYVYLSNDSSYSILVEDGVEISLSECPLSNDDEKTMDHVHQSLGNSDSFSSQNDSNMIQSFTFESQVVSPEFTFYDSTKSSLDDSSYGEKLLRAKMDLSFMYASKENDTWIRALVKDLTVEAGSGLVILDPVDISGGYTSAKDKTNMSLTFTDICVHLSLGTISLLLNLQNQAVTALQFGNAAPVAPCTNFYRIWVSPKEIGPHNNLTFWRPQAPSNYVILGDCVTSRSIPPSQAVMAVSNTYGRVRKPVGFTLIALSSGIQGLGDEGCSEIHECSLWMPVPPPGYSALGCVAHIGNQPPPTHVVCCLRSDLVVSTRFSECMFSAPLNPLSASGFSIWRLDNVIASFCAHLSTEYPPRDISFDLSHHLLWSSTRHHSSSKETASGSTSELDNTSQPTNNESTSSSGWDVVRSIPNATNHYVSTPNFERIWWDKGNDIRRPFSIWRPITRPGFAILGDCITEGLDPPALGIIFKADDHEISSKPTQFTKAAQIMGKGSDEAYFWYPIAAPGYASLGCVVTRVDEAPTTVSFCCPRVDLVSQANIVEVPVARSSSSRASQCWSIWKVENQACTFLARSDLKKPSSRLAFAVGDSLKPKSQENVTFDLKLKCCSITVLDSLFGMMTPLFDTTITNIKLATHGRLDAMNAVLICSIAASAFNTQLEAWEPLVEPFDGIFKFETYNTNVHPPKLAKRVRLAATSILNINASAANLETFVGTILSWRKQLELDQKASKLKEEAGSHEGFLGDPSYSALDEDDFQTVIVENRLGCAMYLKKFGDTLDTVDHLQHGDTTSVWIPPPRFSDRLNVANESRDARCYVVVQILEAKGLPVIDDGNSHNFFCALRLLVDSQTTDQQKLFPQSARTKCVKPSPEKANELGFGAKWNELFILEIPRKAPVKLEVEVTNLAAKAGKGEVVGSLSLPIGHGAVTLKKVASVRMLHQTNDVQNILSCPLKKKHDNVEDTHDYGFLLLSTTYFERKVAADIQRDKETKDSCEGDIGFWIRLSTGGEWESVRSLLPLSVFPKAIQNEFIAMEVVMKDGKKHATFRGLATVENDLDVNLEICVCHVSSIYGHDPSLGVNNLRIAIDEIFENQRYHPISGWGNKWPGFRGNDPGRWSTRDFSDSSKEFFEPSLPSGWKWTSLWVVDKSESVDDDGWAYGPDFHSLRWPPVSKSRTKSAQDMVRRRRWIRRRQQVTGSELKSANGDLFGINPGSSVVLPWKSVFKDSDQCLLVRPCIDHPPTAYSWGQAVTVGKDQPFINQGLLARQNTLKQGSKTPDPLKLNQLEKKDVLLSCYAGSGNEKFWISLGADASVLHTELNAPVYDWRISLNAPLKLENQLPCPAEFTIWEKAKEGSCIERQNGLISPRSSALIYSADINKAIYLTLLIQGGWFLEKDPILVLDIASSEHFSSFWMVNQLSKRRLRVSIERDMGGTIAAPKTIRLFVPYWIVNESSLPLTYRVVEIEPSDNGDADSLSLSRAVKSAKMALRVPTMEKRRYSAKRNVQVLEVIEDTSPAPSMLSLHESAARSAVLLFPTQKDSYLSPHVGLAVAMRHSDIYSPGISLLELEKKERFDVKAFSSDGSYYMLSALLKTLDRTKVVHFQPHTLFINRVGFSLCLRQCDSQMVEWIHPTDPPKPFGWQSSAKVEQLKLMVDGYEWSTSFSVSNEGMMRISLKQAVGGDQMQLRVQVRNGTKRSCHEVIFCPNTLSSSYRIENRSMFLPIHFRQVDGANDSWKLLLPNAAASFLWEDLGRRRLLELLVDGTDASQSLTYDVDEICDHQPFHVGSGPTRALRVTTLKEDKINVVKIRDWMPENDPATFLGGRVPSLLPQQQLSSNGDDEFHFILELAELGVSVVDHTPEEILYLSVQNLLLAYSSGLGSGFSRFKLRMHGIQVDNQLPLTPMPVLFRPQKVGGNTDYILKLSVTLQSNGSIDLHVYPYIGFSGPDGSAFLINIHEPIIWRLHEMMHQINLSRLYDTETNAVSVDPIIQIGVLNISEVRFKVSMAMSPGQRPRGVLGFWSSLMTALGNTENMPVRINQKFHEKICMRQSTMISIAISNVKKDLLGQPLQLLSGVDILGNASSALGHMSKGVAALSMDKKFIQSRQRQENKGVEDFGDVIREGGGALAKGLFRGVTGILTKPLEGAKTSGVEGFVQGVGKGIIGAAAQPVSGVLDLLSKTTEGANAMRMKIQSAITSEEQLLRRRLPRVISGNNLLQPYDDYKAQGQAILQLAESGSFFGQVDLFKIHGKFALSDAYEDHFILPEGKIFVVTHRRVMLLQQPSNIIAQRKFSPARDPCSVVWDVMWDDLMTMELMTGKKDQPNAPPSQLILYLRSRPSEAKEPVRVVKCSRETDQAYRVYTSVERALNTYGTHPSKDKVKNKVTKPYSPSEGANPEVITKDGGIIWPNQVPLSSTFGSSSN